MPYTQPVFPLRCNIWNLAPSETQPIPPSRAADLTGIPAQLAQPLRMLTPDNAISLSHRPPPAVIIRCPSGTTICDGWLSTATPARVYGAIIEIPAGSGVFYGAQMELTVGRGFPNEHVRAVCIRLSQSTGDE